MNRERMSLKKQIHSHYIRWGVVSTEPEGWFHGARVVRRVGCSSKARPFRKGQDARDRITV